MIKRGVIIEFSWVCHGGYPGSLPVDDDCVDLSIGEHEVALGPAQHAVLSGTQPRLELCMHAYIHM